MRFDDKNFRTNLATRLEVRYRDRRASAAYLYLPCREGDLYRGSRPVEKGLVLDYSQSGRLLGIEITAPSLISGTDINDLLGQHGIGPLHEAVLKPLQPI